MKRVRACASSGRSKNFPEHEVTAAGNRWSDALQAAALFAVDPGTGVLLSAQAGPVRDRWMSFVRECLSVSMPFRRLPASITDSRLLGGLDLIATLNSSRPIVERGLLAEADGGVVVVAMAERLPAALAGRLVAVMDHGAVALERDGLALHIPTRFGVIACNEGLPPDEHPPAALADRLAFHLDLEALPISVAEMLPADRHAILAAQKLLPQVVASDPVLEALCSAALALGIDSLRAPLLALRVARASAALDGRIILNDEDAGIAARLVLAARATVLPADPENAPRPEEGEAQAAESSTETSTEEEGEQRSTEARELAEQVVETARAAIPAGLLAHLIAAGGERRAAASGRAGAMQATLRRGRPAGVRKGEPRGGVGLNVVETLRAAAPWQRLRRQEKAQRGVTATSPAVRIDVRPQDFHVNRYRQRIGTTTVFVLDASGSSALQRLAEAKGAVELLLAECYVRRDQVAVLAFRGRTAEVLLPPTRSLVRAKRSLAGLPGGGGTPLAAGIEAAALLADGLRRRGTTPTVVLLTDGRGNVARDGTTGRVVAEEDALKASRLLRAKAISTLLIDTSPRPTSQAQRLAVAMGARYLPLPHANSAALHRAVQGAQ